MAAVFPAAQDVVNDSVQRTTLARDQPVDISMIQHLLTGKPSMQIKQNDSDNPKPIIHF